MITRRSARYVLVLALAAAMPTTSAAAPARPAAKPAAPRPAAPAPPATPPPAAVAAPADEGSALDRAHGMYDEARFGDAAALLREALDTGQVSGDEVIEARALRARCLVKLRHRLEAKEAFKSVLRQDRQFALDPVMVPPDEMEVFKLAQQEIDSEQFEAGKRFPASISFTLGGGNSVNQDIADLASSAGVEPAKNFAESPEFDYAVRFPLRPMVSIEFEVTRIKATTEDKLGSSANAHAKYTASVLPFVLSLVRTLVTSPQRHLNAFVGVGPMPSEVVIETPHSLVSGRVIPTQIVGHNQGWYFHAGLEGEWMMRPRVALTGRLLARRANSGALHWPREDFEIYETWDASKLGTRRADFSGIAASVGVRTYIGY